jgi:LmbE family N-acetylglucosaminyl deacetylase
MGLKLLCVVAHPDDECFAFGGALILAADAGIETSVICLTDGQAAANRGNAGSPAELGRMRREEFQASCKVLGVRHAELMDYADGRLEHANFSQAAGRLVEHMRAFRPNVVITFSPDGTLNTHPDHTMVSAFTCAAYHWAASAKRYPESGPIHHADRLFIVTTSFFMPGRPAPMPAPWTCTLDVRSVMQRRHEAFLEHKSQAPLMEQTRELFKQSGQAEHYTLVAQQQPGPAVMMTSLFQGLQG